MKREDPQPEKAQRGDAARLCDEVMKLVGGPKRARPKLRLGGGGGT